MADVGKILDVAVKTAGKVGDSGIFGKLSEQESKSWRGLNPSRTSVKEGAKSIAYNKFDKTPKTMEPLNEA